MSKKTVGIITMISIILSPLLGGLVGKLVADTNILALSHGYLDDAICFVGMLAWIVASIIFFISFRANE